MMNYVRAGVLLVAIVGCFTACEQKPQPKDKVIMPAPPQQLVQPRDLNNAYEPVDVSPMDMSYFPVHYPLNKLKQNDKEEPAMRIIYSRPHLQGRTLFKDILQYGEAWRLGANEATELDVFRPVYLNNQKINPGRYTLYCIPKENGWIIALNSYVDVWGLKQDSTGDLLRMTVPVAHGNEKVEYFTMVFQKTNTGADLLIAWDDLITKVPFVIK